MEDVSFEMYNNCVEERWKKYQENAHHTSFLGYVNLRETFWTVMIRE